MSAQDEVYKAVRGALHSNPRLRTTPAEEIAHRLAAGGYLEEEPPITLVMNSLSIVRAEEQAFRPGIRPIDV